MTEASSLNNYILGSKIRSPFSRSWQWIRNPLGSSTGCFRVMRCALVIFTLPIGFLGILVTSPMMLLGRVLQSIGSGNYIIDSKEQLEAFIRYYKRYHVVFKSLTIRLGEASIRLPENLEIRGVLKLECPNLTTLPQLSNSVHNLNLTKCTNLLALPENLSLDQLTLEGCSGIKTLPNSLKVNNGLCIFDCDNLESLGTGIVNPKEEFGSFVNLSMHITSKNKILALVLHGYASTLLVRSQNFSPYLFSSIQETKEATIFQVGSKDFVTSCVLAVE